jgi:hypothetical protein
MLDDGPCDVMESFEPLFDRLFVVVNASARGRTTQEAFRHRLVRDVKTQDELGWTHLDEDEIRYVIIVVFSLIFVIIKVVKKAKYIINIRSLGFRTLHYFINPFTAEVAIMRLLGSAPKSHLCDQRRRSKVTGLSDLMTLFIDLGCLHCKQTQRAFNVFKNTLN